MKKNHIFIPILALVLAWAIYDHVIKDNNMIGSSSDYYTEETLQAATVGIEKGMQAPDFTLQNLHGDSISLSDFRGKKVIVNFWATWCPPCQAEMPEMERFHQEFQDDSIILAVNVTNSEVNQDTVRNFVEQNEISFPVLLDIDSEAAEKYGIKPIPTSYLIDEDGMIQQKIIGPMTYDWLNQQMKRM